MITGEAQSAAQSSAVQLDALWCFHALLQASEKALENLNRCQLARRRGQYRQR
jgi:hypothetical protein